MEGSKKGFLTLYEGAWPSLRVVGLLEDQRPRTSALRAPPASIAKSFFVGSAMVLECFWTFWGDGLGWLWGLGMYSGMCSKIIPQTIPQTIPKTIPTTASKASSQAFEGSAASLRRQRRRPSNARRRPTWALCGVPLRLYLTDFTLFRSTPVPFNRLLGN